MNQGNQISSRDKIEEKTSLLQKRNSLLGLPSADELQFLLSKYDPSYSLQMLLHKNPHFLLQLLDSDLQKGLATQDKHNLSIRRTLYGSLNDNLSFQQSRSLIQWDWLLTMLQVLVYLLLILYHIGQKVISDNTDPIYKSVKYILVFFTGMSSVYLVFLQKLNHKEKYSCFARLYTKISVLRGGQTQNLKLDQVLVGDILLLPHLENYILSERQSQFKAATSFLPFFCMQLTPPEQFKNAKLLVVGYNPLCRSSEADPQFNSELLRRVGVFVAFSLLLLNCIFILGLKWVQEKDLPNSSTLWILSLSNIFVFPPYNLIYVLFMASLHPLRHSKILQVLTKWLINNLVFQYMILSLHLNWFQVLGMTVILNAHTTLFTVKAKYHPEDLYDEDYDDFMRPRSNDTKIQLSFSDLLFSIVLNGLYFLMLRFFVMFSFDTSWEFILVLIFYSLEEFMSFGILFQIKYFRSRQQFRLNSSDRLYLTMAARFCLLVVGFLFSLYQQWWVLLLTSPFCFALFFAGMLKDHLINAEVVPFPE